MEDVGGSGMEDDGIFGGQEDSDGGDEDSAAAAAGLFFIRNRKEKEGSGAQKDEGDGQEEEGDSLLPPLTDEPLMVGADDLTTIPIPKKKGEINVNSAVTGIILEHDRIAGGGEDDDGENEMAQAGMGKAGKGGKGGFLMDRKVKRLFKQPSFNSISAARIPGRKRRRGRGRRRRQLRPVGRERRTAGEGGG